MDNLCLEIMRDALREKDSSKLRQANRLGHHSLCDLGHKGEFIADKTIISIKSEANTLN